MARWRSRSRGRTGRTRGHQPTARPPAATTYRRATAAPRRTAALAEAPAPAPHGHLPALRRPDQERSLRDLAGRLTAAARALAPGWRGAPFDGPPPEQPAGTATPPADHVRLGVGHALPDAPFPVVLPLGHATFDADCRAQRVAGAVQALLLRLLAAAPAGSLLIRLVDPDRQVASRFASLHDTGILPPPATDLAGCAAVLTEAEHWMRGRPRDRTLLLVVAGWPPGAGRTEQDRLAALAGAGPGLHLLVSGWRGVPLPGATAVAVRHVYAEVAYPSDGVFAAGAHPPSLLDADVLLDPAPPDRLVDQVCARLADQARADARASLGVLLPAGPWWAEDAADGLTVAVGEAAGAAVTLRMADSAPHWLVGGRRGSGTTTMLHGIVYGLASRYGPDQLTVHLLDPAGGAGFDELAAAVPQVATISVGDRVPEALRRLGSAATGGGRVLCVLDGWQALAAEHLPALAALAAAERTHLLLAGEGPPPAGVAERCRVRVALPGGRVLDPANDAAAGLARGRAVVNTAGGLGGPRGATRAHEQTVSFCDPYADPVPLAGLRHRLSRPGSGT